MALYGTFLYGSELYGFSGIPVSPEWDIYDFCYPIDAVMLSIFSYPEVSAARYGAPWFSFNVDNALCFYSNDEAETSLRIDRSVPYPYHSFQFSLLPTQLPPDFSDQGRSRVFVGLFNQFSKAVGLLLSENGGIALATSGTGAYSILHDSADIFDEGLDYYVFRVVVNEEISRGYLYVTRQSVLGLTGTHQLRYTFTLQDCPAGETDHFRIEVVGTALEPTQVCFQCLRLSTQELIPNRPPVAVIDDDKTCVVNQFAGFDGSGSYDPEGLALKFYWTMVEAPADSPVVVRGFTSEPPAPSGWTNVLTGSAGAYSSFRVGDVIRCAGYWSHIMYVAADGSYVVIVDDDIPTGSSVEWFYIAQNVWGGSRVPSTMQHVLDFTATVPGAPAVGDAYLIDAGALAPWDMHIGEVATWTMLGWSYVTPAAGSIYYVATERATYRTSGAGVWFPDDPLCWELEHWDGVEAVFGSVFGASIGIHTVDLVVHDGTLSSEHAVVVLNVYETGVALGYTPDLSFIWDYLTDFWLLEEGTEKFESIWSALAQISSDELMQLWQHDYSKSIVDIQRVHQRRWINYPLRYDEPNYYELPATIDTTMDVSGWATAPSPVPLPGEPVPDESRIYVLDSLPTGAATGQFLVLKGIAYKIVRIEGTSLITDDAMPVAPLRLQSWSIRNTVTSRSSNFSSLRVQLGDSAIFEVRGETDSAFEVACFIWGVRGSTLCFDPAPLASYDMAEVKFRAVLRRGATQIHKSIQSVPKLQEVIALSRVDGAPDPFNENRDYRVDTVQTVEGIDTRQIDLMDCFFSDVSHGWTGTASSSTVFSDPSAHFLTDLGPVGTDLRGYVLKLSYFDLKYRLDQVLSDTTLQVNGPILDPAMMINVSWKVMALADVPDRLWAELTYLDNSETIEANFGSQIGFTLDHLEERTDNLDYLSATQGLWYYIWNGRTPERVAAACQIILGLPFAEVGGTVVEIQEMDTVSTRVLIRDAANENVVRSYRYPTIVGIGTNPSTGTDYVVGDTVEQFDPLSKGVGVKDYVSDPDWFGIYAGSGDFYEPQKVHTFGVIIDSDVFDLVNVLFTIQFIKEKRPPYTYPFFVVAKDMGDTVDTEDPFLIGPVVPALGFTYPTDWPAYTWPATWPNSPFEVARAATTNDPMTGWTTPRPPREFIPFGGLHLYDSAAHVPEAHDQDGHVPERSGSAMKFDSRHGDGSRVHRYDRSLHALTRIGDGDMEDPTNPGPGSDWHLLLGGFDPYTIQKSVVQQHAGARSCLISSNFAEYGIGQYFNDNPVEGFQIAARGWIYVDDGSALIRLLDNDAATVLAERKFAVPIKNWFRWTLHAWAVGNGTDSIELQIVTGPAGGIFYVDDVSCYHSLVPWEQWGFDRTVSGRTGGYTRGGNPDEFYIFNLHTEI